MVLATTEFPQLSVDTVVDALLVQFMDVIDAEIRDFTCAVLDKVVGTPLVCRNCGILHPCLLCSPRLWWSFFCTRACFPSANAHGWSILHPRLLSKRRRLWWRMLLPRLQLSKRHRQWWRILHPRQQFFIHQRLWWSLLHPRQPCPKRRRQVWSTSHPHQRVYFQFQWWRILHPSRLWLTRQRQAVDSISPALAVVQSPTPVVEYISPASAVFLAPAQLEESISPAPAVSRSPAPVVEHFSPAPVVSSPHRGHEEAVPRVTLLLRMGMDGRRFRVFWWLRRCLRRTRRRRTTTMTMTRSMGRSLVFPLGSGPCGCAGGLPLGTAGRVGGVCLLTL